MDHVLVETFSTHFSLPRKRWSTMSSITRTAPSRPPTSSPVDRGDDQQLLLLLLDRLVGQQDVVERVAALRLPDLRDLDQIAVLRLQELDPTLELIEAKERRAHTWVPGRRGRRE